MTTEAHFARKTAYDATLYNYLAKHERVPQLKSALVALAAVTGESAAFWNSKSKEPVGVVRLSFFSRTAYRVMRMVLGVTLTTKYILGRKEAQVATYKNYCTTCTVDEDYKKIDEFADRMHAIVGDLEEERVKFFSNVVLGFNDALIELTGALVGFTFALRDTGLITLAGLVTGLSASLSMAASAYQQARHEKGRNPFKAALFTGISYLAIATALVLPFIIASTIWGALVAMAVVVVCIIVSISFASSILLERRYVSQLGEMLVFSLGVALIAFLIGHVLGNVIS